MNPRLLLIGFAGVLLIVAIVLGASMFIITESDQVIITEFGKPVGQPMTEAGLHFKLPFIQEVNYIDKRILDWDGMRTEMPTKDKLYISVDTFGRWRITDPLEYFLRLRDERSAQSRLEDILGSETRNAIAKHDLIEVVRTTIGREPERSEELGDTAAGAPVSIGVLHKITKGRSAIEREVLAAAKSKLAGLGIDLLDIRFKRINYNPSVVDKIYERMVSERQQIASLFRSEGEGEAAKIIGDMQRDLDEIESEAYRQVQEIRGQADARATEIYAAAFDQSPAARDLYEFLKTLESYRAIIDSNSTLLLTTDSDIFRLLKSGASAP